MPSKRLFIAVAILVVVLLTAGWWAADIQTAQMQRWLATGHLPPIGNPWKGTSTPDFYYYMTINAICVSIVLLIPAIGAFVLRRPAGNGPVWLMFWTAAWFAFVVHLWYGVVHVLGGYVDVLLACIFQQKGVSQRIVSVDLVEDIKRPGVERRGDAIGSVDVSQDLQIH